MWKLNVCLDFCIIGIVLYIIISSYSISCL
uniref:Uncharacterized protein n=1 Tax=Rhizophora mucronata TaxID=61149 RepID=A0A2P2NBK4_RHIMU